MNQNNSEVRDGRTDYDDQIIELAEVLLDFKASNGEIAYDLAKNKMRQLFETMPRVYITSARTKLAEKGIEL